MTSQKKATIRLTLEQLADAPRSLLAEADRVAGAAVAGGALFVRDDQTHWVRNEIAYTIEGDRELVEPVVHAVMNIARPPVSRPPLQGDQP